MRNELPTGDVVTRTWETNYSHDRVYLLLVEAEKLIDEALDYIPPYRSYEDVRHRFSDFLVRLRAAQAEGGGG